jgi:hypothetical protein
VIEVTPEQTTATVRRVVGVVHCRASVNIPTETVFIDIVVRIIGTDIANISLAIAVGVLLARIFNSWTVVADVPHTVEIAVGLVLIGNAGAIVTDIAKPVLVGVFLTGIIYAVTVVGIAP